MNDQTLTVFAGVFLIILSSYYIYKIITIFKNRSIAKQKREDFFYRHFDSFKSAGFEAFECIVQIFLIILWFKNRLFYIRHQDINRNDELWINIIFFTGVITFLLIRLIYIFLYYKLPFIITDKYFIINGKIHKNSKIFYSYLDENIIVAKEYFHGKTNELLRISMDESKVIQTILKYSSLKDISLITCKRDENSSSGY
jgi:hypothetical protein